MDESFLDQVVCILRPVSIHHAYRVDCTLVLLDHCREFLFNCIHCQNLFHPRNARRAGKTTEFQVTWTLRVAGDYLFEPYLCALRPVLKSHIAGRSEYVRNGIVLKKNRNLPWVCSTLLICRAIRFYLDKSAICF